MKLLSLAPMSSKKQISNSYILAVSIGIIYLWFGSLKFFPGLSPAEELAKNTISTLTFNLIPKDNSIILLAIWETLIGLLLILNVYRRTVIMITFVHIILTFSPLFFFPEQAFTSFPFGLTLLGQYLIKNLIIVASLFMLYRLPSTK